MELHFRRTRTASSGGSRAGNSPSPESSATTSPIQKTIDEIVDEAAGNSQVEFVSEFAIPLTARVTMSTLHLPVVDTLMTSVGST
ncbi:hypothetical protein [Pseudonocardia xishanensis]|uniref:Uncharacterized protein n=1 Tax=Pseudonocardia xishanensis TaxID=630995 RepID=A0ABP8RYX6_9PSEU